MRDTCAVARRSDCDERFLANSNLAAHSGRYSSGRDLSDRHLLGSIAPRRSLDGRASRQAELKAPNRLLFHRARACCGSYVLRDKPQPASVSAVKPHLTAS